MAALTGRTLSAALACAIAACLLPAPGLAQLGAVDPEAIEVPEVGDRPLELPQAPSADELVGGLEEQTGIDIPGAGEEASPPAAGEPAGSPPPASAPPASSAPSASGTPADPSTSAVGEVPAPVDTGAPGAPAGGDGRDGTAEARGGREERSDRTSRRARAAEPAAAESEERSPVGRVIDAVAELPMALFGVIAALALLGFLMAGRSSRLVAIQRRLRSQGEVLREDIGALQAALLPEVPERIGSVEISLAYRAAAGPASGGDFHDVFRLDDNRFAVIVGDISGHGRDALTLTALVHYTVRAYLEAGIVPRRALQLTDQALGRKLSPDFVTVLIAIYDERDSTLEYASAGHPVPMVVGQGEDHAVAAMTSPPIGIGLPTGFRSTKLGIGRASRICLCSDGLIEMRAGEGEFLEREGVSAALSAGGEDVDAEALLESLLARAEAGDDVTVCLLRPLNASGASFVAEELELDGQRDPKGLAGLLVARGLAPAEVSEVVSAVEGGDGPHLLRVESAGGRASWRLEPLASAAGAVPA